MSSRGQKLIDLCISNQTSSAHIKHSTVTSCSDNVEKAECLNYINKCSLNNQVAKDHDYTCSRACYLDTDVEMSNNPSQDSANNSSEIVTSSKCNHSYLDSSACQPVANPETHNYAHTIDQEMPECSNSEVILDLELPVLNAESLNDRQMCEILPLDDDTLLSIAQSGEEIVIGSVMDTISEVENNSQGDNALSSIVSSGDNGVIDSVMDTLPEEENDVQETGIQNKQPSNSNNTATTVMTHERPLLSDSSISHLNYGDEMEIESECTKSGDPRRRRKFVFKPLERKEMKRKIRKNLHAIKNACSSSCKLKCSTEISQERRTEINSQYWDLSTSNDQKTFVLGCISKAEVKRRTVKVVSHYRRSTTNHYCFKNDQGKCVRVCKTFFLTTLGYRKSNDKILQNLCKETNISPSSDKRKGREPKNKLDHTVIQKHIESFEPTIAHYRREHAPNRRYLPSDLTVTQMHTDFIRNYPGFKCSYELYRSEVAKLNISFVKLGHEECEMCEHFNIHPHNKENMQHNCEDCQKWQVHIKKAESAREEYRKDADKIISDDEHIYSVDLQKVIMLPRCEMFKSVVFTKRLTVYNESFVPVGTKSSLQSVACLWHEGIRGRRKEDIVSTFYKFLITAARDVKHVVLWMDNCTAQNKNWTFFTFLVFCVNCPNINAETIQIKYFEPGHTFMSADSFHHRVEKSLHQVKKVYDFEDFKTAVQHSSSRVTVIQMEVKDFMLWKDLSIKKKRSSNHLGENPYLREIVSVEAQRGEMFLKIKREMNDLWQPLHFVNAKGLKSGISLPSSHSTPQGISQTRKTSILQNLVKGKNGIIPQNRLQFWLDLPLSGDKDDE